MSFRGLRPVSPCRSDGVSGGWRDRTVRCDDLHLETTGVKNKSQDLITPHLKQKTIHILPVLNNSIQSPFILILNHYF